MHNYHIKLYVILQAIVVDSLPCMSLNTVHLELFLESMWSSSDYSVKVNLINLIGGNSRLYRGGP